MLDLDAIAVAAKTAVDHERGWRGDPDAPAWLTYDDGAIHVSGFGAGVVADYLAQVPPSVVLSLVQTAFYRHAAERPIGKEAPFPDTYDGAVAEIRRLRGALTKANEKWAASQLKAHLDAKSRRAQASSGSSSTSSASSSASSPNPFSGG